MIKKPGEKFTDIFRKNMPDAFVFALLLTLFTALVAFFWMGTPPFKIIQSWYDGFWTLLEFGMQMVLLIITGYSIALSPLMEKGIDRLSTLLKTPRQVYFTAVMVGFLLSMVSWGWLIITAVFARQLALRIKGINYPYLIACVYFSMISWVAGLSSSIPLLLNTKGNFLIEEGILSETIPTTFTLGSLLNIWMIILFLAVGPLLMLLLAPKNTNKMEINDLMVSEEMGGERSIA
ncbi:MAG TPA: TIGR00366 family protein, partial [Eudoraea sp.]|nr:TIGR00366 family protein [Eudoraea sp.]